MEDLIIDREPELSESTMVIGFTGWMNGGQVSTGSIDFFKSALKADRFAHIDAADFYVHNFPAGTMPVTLDSDGERTIVRSVTPMEQAAIFRPHTEIADGIVESLDLQTNEFSCTEDAGIILFSGEEPHIRWGTYADCMLQVARENGCQEILFAGSVSSPIPHTREPRVHASVSNRDLKQARSHPEVDFTDYEGPASFVTYLLQKADENDIPLWTLVVEIPHYPFLDIQTYPASMLKVCKVLNDWLNLDMPLSKLKERASAVGHKLDSMMEENEEFRQIVERLQQAYDREEAAVDEDVLKRLIDEIDFDDNIERGQHN